MKTNIYLHDTTNNGLYDEYGSLIFSASDESHARNLANAWNDQLKQSGEYPSKFYYVGY